MKKTLIAALLIAFSSVNFASAQSDVDIYPDSETSVSSDENVVNIAEIATDGPTTAITVSDEAAVSTNGEMRPPGPKPLVAPGIRAVRETNRQLIERIRREKQMKARTTGTKAIDTTSQSEQARGEVRVLRVDGQTIEDRAIKIPNSVPGRPIFFRASSTRENSDGIMIRAVAASGSRAIFLRDSSSSIEMPWVSARPFGEAGGVRIFSSTTAEGDVTFSFEKRPPIQDFLGKVFNLFRKAGLSNQ